jgi:hypothetical protein
MGPINITTSIILMVIILAVIITFIAATGNVDIWEYVKGYLP